MKAAYGPFRSNPSSRILATIAVFVAALPLCGCFTYGRIVTDAPTDMHPRASTTGGPYYVVNLEIDLALRDPSGNRWKPYDFPEGMLSTNAPAIQKRLESARPESFSSAPGSLPIVVRLRSLDQWFPKLTPGRVATAVSLGSLPITFESQRMDADLSVQIGPGTWSDERHRRLSERGSGLNPVAAALFSWFFRERDGWQRFHGTGHTLPIRFAAGDGPGAVINWRDVSLWPLDYLGEESHNAGFDGMLADWIIETIEEMSPQERISMQNNPAARKRLAEDNPFMAGKLLGGGSKTYHISIPSEDNCPILEPITIEKRFDTASRRGLVRFDENGVEHLSALKMIRENVIAPMVGIGGKIRILSEATGPDNVHSIEFEVVE